ncbi:MAG TPA: MG2 domain-containing protein [Planctomycetia bacterium]|nr:MG2 domain-containing protein [Planctomycetia bacterium]
MRLAIGLSLVCLGVTLAAGRVEKPDDAASLVKAADEAYGLQSYRTAIAKAEAALKVVPPGEVADRMTKIYGVSKIKLQDWTGVRTIDDLQRRSPQFAQDVEIAETVADAAMQMGEAAVPVSQRFDRAIALHAAAGNSAKQLQLLFKVADFVRERLWNPGFPGVNDWRLQQIAGRALALSLYDRALAVGGRREDQVRALRSKADVMRMNANNNDMPRASWPPLAGVDYPQGMEKPIDLAVTFEREIVRRFPNTTDANQAMLRVGGTFNDFGRFTEAVAAFNDLVALEPRAPEATDAKNAIASIKAPVLGIGIAGVGSPEIRGRYDWTARNVGAIELTAYPVELFTLARKCEELSNLDVFPLAGIAPAAKWTVETGDAGKHEYLSSGNRPPQPRPIPLPRGRRVRPVAPPQGQPAAPERPEIPLEKSGAYVIVATGKNPEGKTATVRALALVSNLTAVAKTGRTKAVAFAVLEKDGKPAPGTELLIQRWVRQYQVPIIQSWKNEYAYEQKPAGDAGFTEIETNSEGPRRVTYAIAKHGDDYAVLGEMGFHQWWWFNQHALRVFAYTDRPVYRPEQTVQFRHVLREYKQGEYVNVVNRKVRVIVSDPRGATVFDKELVTSAFGSVSGEIQLGSTAPLGTYHMQVTAGDLGVEVGPGANFQVEEYKKPEFEVQISSAKQFAKIGQPLEVKIHGEYYFGGAVANASIQVTVHRQATGFAIPWRGEYDWFFEGEEWAGMGGRGRRMYRPWQQQRRDLVQQATLKTDAAGNATLAIPTAPFPQAADVDLEYIVEAKMVDQSRREIVGSKGIKVTRQAFAIGVHSRGALFRPGDKIQLEVKAQDPNGKPVALKGERILQRVDEREVLPLNGAPGKPEKLTEIGREAIELGATGAGETALRVEEEGLFKVTVSAPEPFGGKSEGSQYVWVTKTDGRLAHLARRDLEIIADKSTVEPGEGLRLLVASKHPDAYVLLTVEADDIYHSQVVYVKEKTTTVELPIARNFQPNATVRALLVRDRQIFSDEKTLRVPPLDRMLKVIVKTPRKEFRPREVAEIEVEARDWKGNPVAAELSLGATDASVYYIKGETRGDIRKFFHGRQRPSFVRQLTGYEFQSSGQAATLFAGTKSLATGAMRGGGFGGAPGAPAPAMDAAAPMAMMARAEGAERGRADVKMEAAKENDGKKKDGGPELKEAEVRSEFPDTVYWAANLTTGADGKARTTIRFPDSLTTWRIAAIGTTADTQVGEVVEEAITRKNVIVRLQSPRFTVERDSLVFSTIVNNYLKEEKEIKVGLESTAEIEIAAPTDGVETRGGGFFVRVPAGGEKRIDFSARVLRPGKATLIAKAQTDVESDAMRIELPALEYGARKLLVHGGAMTARPDTDEGASMELKIPAEIRPGSQKLSIRVDPTIAGVIVESLPYLIEYPYGCVEQTMSRFLPAVLASRTLAGLGLDLAALRDRVGKDPALKQRLQHLSKNPVFDPRELDKIVAAGVKRLADMQGADGGWGWWKQDASNPYLSAYVLSGLATAQQAGVKLPDGMMQRGIAFVAKIASQDGPLHRYPWQASEDAAVRAYLLHALAEAAPAKLKEAKLREKLDETFNARTELGDYSRALLALALSAAGMKEQADIVVANIKDRANLDAETGSASWGTAHGYYYWYDCGTEATSYSLRALLKLEPQSPLIPQAVQWLLRHRQGTRWFNTKDTAIVCYSLVDYLKSTRELNPDLTVTIEVNGRTSKTFRLTKDTLLQPVAVVELAGEALGTGSVPVTIKCRGVGRAYFTASATFFTKEDPIAAAGSEIFVDRRYEKLTPRTVEKSRKVYDRAKNAWVDETYREIEYDRRPITEGETLTSGDLVDVALKVKANNNFEYVMIEDPKPAGCEPTELLSGHDWGGGLSGHREMRDQKVGFFVTYLNRGSYEIRYRLRAEIPGKFHALPTQAECMYAPLVKGNGPSAKMTIADAKK